VKWGIVFTVAIVFGIGIGLSLNVSAEEGLIPSWIKNTAGFWVDGNVEDSEFISALQFLVNHGIMEIPITEVVATTVNLEDKDRAMSLVVHFSDSQDMGKGITIYTFHTFFHFSANLGTTTLDFTQGLENSPAFTLQSLPSKDKSQLYGLVEDYVSRNTPEPFTVEVDILAGDGEVIQTWEYRKCAIEDYTVFSDQNKENYRFSNTDDIELRELFVFACSGYHLRS